MSIPRWPWGIKPVAMTMVLGMPMARVATMHQSSELSSDQPVPLGAMKRRVARRVPTKTGDMQPRTMVRTQSSWRRSRTSCPHMDDVTLSVCSCSLAVQPALTHSVISACSGSLAHMQAWSRSEQDDWGTAVKRHVVCWRWSRPGGAKESAKQNGQEKKAVPGLGSWSVFVSASCRGGGRVDYTAHAGSSAIAWPSCACTSAVQAPKTSRSRKLESDLIAAGGFSSVALFCPSHTHRRSLFLVPHGGKKEAKQTVWGPDGRMWPDVR